MTLADFLKQRDLSGPEFAAMIGVERQAVHRYLAGQRFPSRAILARIAEVTEGAVTANDFVQVESAA